LFNDALGDVDYRVRHAALSGLDHFDLDTAVSVVMRALTDTNRSVRAQAAVVLAKYGSAAAGYLADIERLRQQETDPQVRQLLTVSIKTNGGGPSCA
jgi:HEAT repeat protein